MSGIPDRLAAALADRYRRERELGQGGPRMGHRDDHRVAAPPSVPILG